MKNPSDTLTIAKDELDEVLWLSKDEVNSVAMLENWKQAINLYFTRN